MLIAKGIHKVYKNGQRELEVLKDVDLEIRDSEALGIVGPSGAGKSTLLHILGGLDSPTDGEVILDGESLYNLGDSRLARIRNQKVGFVFQFYHLLGEFSALENVMLPALLAGNKRIALHDIRARAYELLKEVGLADRGDHRPNALSGGEAQRVAVARALVNEPRLLLCDEPTGNLDSKTAEGVLSLLFGLNKERRQTIVIVTHDDQIARSCGRTIRIRDGRIS